MDFLSRIFKGDKVIWAIFILLCLISVVEVFSAASTLTYKSGDFMAPISGHIKLILFGVFVLVVFHHIPFKWYKLISLLCLGSALIFLIYLIFKGQTDSSSMVNGSSRFIPIFGIQFQPSELAKMGLVIYSAAILANRHTEEGAHKDAFWWILIPMAVFCLLIIPENFSTALLLGVSISLLMIVGRVSWKKLVPYFGCIALIGSLFLTILFVVPEETLDKYGHRATTWKHRIEGAMHPGDNVPPEKYNIEDNRQKAFANIAISQSGIFGKGPGNSIQRDFLSQAFSDFIYAIILEELGLVGGVFVVLLYIILLIRIGIIAQRCESTFPALLIMGIGILIAVQTIYNTGVAVDILPITGQPLPLISKGGTSMLINCAYIGMILSVSNYTEKLRQKKLEAEMGIEPTETDENDTYVEPDEDL